MTDTPLQSIQKIQANAELLYAVMHGSAQDPDVDFGDESPNVPTLRKVFATMLSGHELVFETAVSDNSGTSLQEAHIPSIIMFCRTVGYYSYDDDGGAARIRGSYEIGTVQDADGAYWRLAEKVINPCMVGARGTGTESETAFLQIANDLAEARKANVEITKHHGLGATLYISAPFLGPGKISVLPGFVPDNLGLTMPGGGTGFYDVAIINKHYSLSYNSSTADRIVIGGGLNFEWNCNKKGQFIALLNVYKAIFDDIEMIAPNTTTGTCGALIDLFACWNCVTIGSNVHLKNVAGDGSGYWDARIGATVYNVGGGCLWIRNWTIDGSNPNNKCRDVTVEDGGLYECGTCDEAVSVMGRWGILDGGYIGAVQIKGLPGEDGVSYPSESHLFSVQSMNQDDPNHYAQVNNYRINAARFKCTNPSAGLIKLGQSDDSNGSVNNLVFENSTIEFTMTTVNPNAIVIVGVAGQGTMVRNVTINPNPSSTQPCPFGIKYIDYVKGITMTGDPSKITNGIWTTKSVEDCPRIIGDTLPIYNIPIQHRLTVIGGQNAIDGSRSIASAYHDIDDLDITLPAASGTVRGIRFQNYSDGLPYGRVNNVRTHASSAAAVALSVDTAMANTVRLYDSSIDGPTGVALLASGTAVLDSRGNMVNGVMV